MTRRTAKWLHGFCGGMVGGGAQAVIAGLGLAGAQAIGVQVQALDWKQLCTVFATGAVVSAMLWLKQSPLPPLEGDTEFTTKPKDPDP